MCVGDLFEAFLLYFLFTFESKTFKFEHKLSLTLAYN